MIYRSQCNLSACDIKCHDEMQIHTISHHTLSLSGSVWDKLDRPTVLQHMVSLSSLATLALDYRRAHGDQSEAGEEVLIFYLLIQTVDMDYHLLCI